MKFAELVRMRYVCETFAARGPIKTFEELSDEERVGWVMSTRKIRREISERLLLEGRTPEEAVTTADQLISELCR